jgi:hypothetical protein
MKRRYFTVLLATTNSTWKDANASRRFSRRSSVRGSKKASSRLPILIRRRE